MPPNPTQGGRTHSHPRVTLQTVAEGGVPQGSVEYPPTYGALALSGRNCTAHVAHGGDPTVVGMGYPGPNYKRCHRHTGHSSARDPVEGGGGAYIHLSTLNPPVAQRLTRVQVRKRDGDGYNGVETHSRDLHHRPRPPLHSIPGHKEVL